MSNWDRFLNSFFNARVAWDYLPKIADGFVLTVVLALCVIVTGLAAGLVLAVARASGLNIPSGCTFGLCGTCKIMKTEGEVHMVHNGGISDEDIEEGYILACCSNPIGKVVVEV